MHESEAQLESRLVKVLVNNGYESVEIKDEDDLINNFRKQLNKHNENVLNKTPLSDREFNHLLTKISGLGVFDASKALRDIHNLERDNGEIVYLQLFNTRDWCHNIFQVTNQITVKGKYENRYDVTLLINGLPLVQIELKRRGGDIEEAFHQITRYREHSYKYSQLFRFLQIFVISNGTDSKYLANSTSKNLSLEYAFYWTDIDNKYCSQLDEFALYFLDRCNIGKMIARYMVLHEADKQLMIMRPYQVYAAEAIINRVKETQNNGYIWHTTGSGKTLTSFKSAQIVSNLADVEKVFFLVDRKDLDNQTIKEFNAFSKDSIDQTNSTNNLVSQIKDKNRKIIVTTIQKMSKAVEKYSKVFEELKDQRVVFIIDECHRSQFGSMHQSIQRFFTKAQYIGFTGTPIMEENQSADGRSTADIFEVCLHKYLIKDAIKDKNVLPFSIEYYKTLEGKETGATADSSVPGIDKEEILLSDGRIDGIVKAIATHHDAMTHGRKMNALMTVNSGVSGVPMLSKYYQSFKKYNKTLKNPLKIAAIFSFGANDPLTEVEGNTAHHRDILEEVIKDYNEMFDENYSTDNFSGYFLNVSERFKKTEIDILLVVNMFLTGFDAKPLNTLYVDRNLEYHGLVQAFSRTNRIYKSFKTQGNIVCFRNLKPNVDKALRLFSNGEESDTLLMKPLEDVVDDMNFAIAKLRKIAPTLDHVDSLEKEEDIAEFAKTFRTVARLMIRLKAYMKFEMDLINIDEQTYEDYAGKYAAIRTRTEREKISVLDEFDFQVELLQKDKINVSYILNLIFEMPNEKNERQDKSIQEILDAISSTTDERLRSKSELIEEFLLKIVPTLGESSDLQYEYEKFEQAKQSQRVGELAEEFNLTRDRIYTYIEDKIFSNYISDERLNEDITGTLLSKVKKKKIFIDKLNKIVTDFE
ncbi:type I restriction endonuclease subunit R [Peptostreptococcus faecalis]|uniref:type I restriction endonuclease subunit R n=1 Tax=Peptostreptococcus faecalis TaxID=2045015 RepID=UPI000C79BF73|nr:type I restriction endonuclease subunit R [Peptostreptococcus faecalis]